MKVQVNEDEMCLYLGYICSVLFVVCLFTNNDWYFYSILMFEEKGKEKPLPQGKPRRRHIESLIAQ